jgi:hypothetical protein
MHLESVRRQKRTLAVTLTPCEVNDSSHRNPPLGTNVWLACAAPKWPHMPVRHSLTGLLRGGPNTLAPDPVSAC